jgi:hypothetical protein
MMTTHPAERVRWVAHVDRFEEKLAANHAHLSHIPVPVLHKRRCQEGTHAVARGDNNALASTIVASLSVGSQSIGDSAVVGSIDIPLALTCVSQANTSLKNSSSPNLTEIALVDGTHARQERCKRSATATTRTRTRSQPHTHQRHNIGSLQPSVTKSIDGQINKSTPPIQRFVKTQTRQKTITPRTNHPKGQSHPTLSTPKDDHMKHSAPRAKHTNRSHTMWVVTYKLVWKANSSVCGHPWYVRRHMVDW